MVKATARITEILNEQQESTKQGSDFSLAIQTLKKITVQALQAQKINTFVMPNGKTLANLVDPSQPNIAREPATHSPSEAPLASPSRPAPPPPPKPPVAAASVLTNGSLPPDTPPPPIPAGPRSKPNQTPAPLHPPASAAPKFGPEPQRPPPKRPAQGPLESVSEGTILAATAMVQNIIRTKLDPDSELAKACVRDLTRVLEINPKLLPKELQKAYLELNSLVIIDLKRENLAIFASITQSLQEQNQRTSSRAPVGQPPPPGPPPKPPSPAPSGTGSTEGASPSRETASKAAETPTPQRRPTKTFPGGVRPGVSHKSRNQGNRNPNPDPTEETTC